MPHEHPSEHRPHPLVHTSHQHKKTEIAWSKSHGKATVIGKKCYLSEAEILNIFKKKGMSAFPKGTSPKFGGNFRGTKYAKTAVDGTPLRFIESCRNQHRGEEIWILGCGPSLDDFPDDFFESREKISIAIKYARVAFPGCTYYHDSYASLVTQAFIRNNRFNLLEKFIFLLKKQYRPNWPTGYNSKPIYQPTGLPVIRKIIQSIPEFGSTWGLAKTVSHSAIEAAVVFGAKRITLVGCELQSRGKQTHARKRGMSLFYWQCEGKKIYSQPVEKARAGTRAVARALESKGIEIKRYFYNRGYEAIK